MKGGFPVSGCMLGACSSPASVQNPEKVAGRENKLWLGHVAWRCLWDTHMEKCGCLQVPLAPAHPAFSASQPPPSPIFHHHPRATSQWKVPMLTLDSQGPRLPGPSMQQWFASYGWAITDPPDFQPALTEGWAFSLWFPLPSVGCYLPLSDVT